MTKYIQDDLSDNLTIDSLIKLIGEESFGKLSDELAGRRIHIPLKPGQHSPLSVCLGMDAAEKICKVYGGMQLEVPISHGKRSKVLKLYNAGIPKGRIAVELRCTRRFVINVINEAQMKKQPSLF